MKRRGVCYGVGRVMWGQNWRPEFSAAEAHRELAIIKSDLHCNAVRICGEDLDRLMIAGKDALNQGLEVWLSPELWDRSPKETLEYVASAAERADELHKHRPGEVVLSIGSELTLFMDGIVEGSSVSSGNASAPARTTDRSTPSWPRPPSVCASSSTAASPTPRCRSRRSSGAGSTS